MSTRPATRATRRTSPRQQATGPLNEHFTTEESSAIRAGLIDKTPEARTAFVRALARLVAAEANMPENKVVRFLERQAGGFDAEGNIAGSAFEFANDEAQLAGAIQDAVAELAAYVQEAEESSSAGSSVRAGRGAGGRDIETVIANVDFLVRLLLRLRNYEKGQEKEGFVEALQSYIKEYGSKQGPDWSRIVSSFLRPHYSDSDFSQGIGFVALKVLKEAQKEDRDNWFGTLDAHIFFHLPSLQGKEPKADEKPKEPEVLHFSILCAGIVPNKKTLDRFGFSAKQITKAQVIFHSFFYLSSVITQGRRLGNANLALKNNLEFLKSLVDSIPNTNWAIHFNELDVVLSQKGREGIKTQINAYINKTTVEDFEKVVNKIIATQVTNHTRANKSTRVRSEQPMAFQKERRGTAIAVLKPIVLLEPFRAWLKAEKLPKNLFQSVATAGAAAVGGKATYDAVRREVGSLLGLTVEPTLLEMGVAFTGTVVNILQIPLFLGGENTMSLTGSKGLKYSATEALRTLLNAEIEYGLDEEGRPTRGAPTSILEVSNQDAAAKRSRNIKRGKVAQRSAVRRRGQGLDTENFATKDFTSLAARLTQPFRYTENGEEVDEIAQNPDLLHFFERNITEGVTKVSTDEMSLGESNVTAGQVRAALRGENEAVNAAYKAAAKQRDTYKSELVEAQEKEEQLA